MKFFIIIVLLINLLIYYIKMDEIEIAINEMILQLKSLCPVLIPSIFPSNRIVESFNQLFTNDLYIGI